MPRMATAAILVGGESRRMGRDKSTLVWQGKPLWRHVYDAVRPLVSEVLIVGRPDRCDWSPVAVPQGCRFVADEVQARGPLAGIDAALRYASHTDVLVTACDLPHLQKALLAGLLDDARGDVVITRRQGRFEPLPAVYRKRCREAVEMSLSGGPCAVRSFFPRVDLSIWEPEDWRELDPGGDSFRNLNSPADL